MRPYQIVVWGATGFTGKLTAEYLASAVPPNFRWAIAGRNRQRLEEVKKDVLKKARPDAKVDILIGDSAKPDTLDEITSATDVLISAVGPFVLYGTPLVQSCVKNGTDYVDITGESHWVRKIIKDYHQEAKEKGVAIVNGCGFDSIPSDLGALFVANQMKQRFGTRCSKISLYVTEIKGGVSGGTLHSACTAFETGAFSPENRDPYSTEDYTSLSNASKREKIVHRDTHDPLWIQYDFDRAKWTGPWIMASTNGKCVRRSNSLLSYALGPELRYSEVMEYKNFLAAFFTTVCLFVFSLLLVFGPTRNLVKRFLPQPGQGPSKELLASGHMRLTIIGTSESDPNKKSHSSRPSR
eukprot:TRINITY_DN1837_c0_g1_i1.p1 TRINITY_DN1837_c0_g1~~TRINITY_DN1837_c0_g1_i1.p1  ORF type:complete len:364 (-),score=90.46 TRINITY_DN1837_c0_g1_i1:277-1335(-)